MNPSILRVRCFALALALIASAPAGIGQTTIQVPADAATIQTAIDRAHNGDIVQVAPGTYNENLDFKGKAITVTTGAKSFGDAASTTINGTQEGPVVSFQTGETASTVLNGFTIRNGHATPGSGTPGGGIFINNASPTISNNVITNNTGCGVMAVNNAGPLIQGNNIKLSTFPPATTNQKDDLCASSFGSTGSGVGLFLSEVGSVQVIGNVIEENAVNQALNGTETTGAGVYVNIAQRLLLQQNIIRNNTAAINAGFEEPLAQPVADLVMIDNLFYGNGSPLFRSNSIQVFISGSAGGGTPKLTEINNTIYGEGQELVWTFGSSVVANNIFVNTVPGGDEQFAGMFCADPPAQVSPIDFHNNDIYNFGTQQPTLCKLGAGNVFVDPSFRDPTNGDFHELATSPTIAAGDINAPSIPTADLDYKSRTVCGSVDLGAYELHPTPSVSLTSSSNPAPGGSTLSFTAVLTGNCNVPSGSMTFLDAGTAIGTATLNNAGAAVLTTSLLVVGQHKITASYPGDFNFDGSTSDTLLQTITGDPTTTSLSISPNPANAYSPIALTAKVTSSYGTPTGQVQFLAGGTLLTTATLGAGGVANASIATLGEGNYPIVATYTADTRFQPSSSAPVQETVNGVNTTTVLTATPNPAAVTQGVTFTARVRPTNGTMKVPAGTVTLLDGGTTLSTANLNSQGIAIFNISSLSFGSHTVTARYAGSQDFNPSSAMLTESVTSIGTALALVASPNPSNTGQAITLTATASALLPGVTPFGAVSFRDGLDVLGTVDLDDHGVATYTTSSLAVGTHPLQANLGSTSSFVGSVSPVVNEIVQSYDFTLNSSRTSLSIPSGDWTTFDVTVTPIGGFVGSVNLSCSGLPEHVQCSFSSGGSVDLSTGSKTIQMSINTSDVYGYGDKISSLSPRSHKPSGSRATLAVFLLPFIGLVGLKTRRGMSLARRASFVLALTGILLSVTSCSGKLPAKAAPGNYVINLVGVANGASQLKHTVSIQLGITSGQ